MDPNVLTPLTNTAELYLPVAKFPPATRYGAVSIFPGLPFVGICGLTGGKICLFYNVLFFAFSEGFLESYYKYVHIRIILCHLVNTAH
jgi:hypothetical protein